MSGFLLFKYHQKSKNNYHLDFKKIKEVLPEANSWTKTENGFAILDKEKKPLASAISTMPESKEIIGYAGPEDVIILLDKEEKIIGITLNSS